MGVGASMMSDERFRVDPDTLDPALQRAGLEAAFDAIRGVFPPTPLLESISLSAFLGRPVWLKLETVTPVRAFKVRGAIAKAAELQASGREGGLVTASAGNHGLAVAFAGRRLGRPVTVFVPDHANPVKVAAIRAMGAETVFAGHTLKDLTEQALPFTERTGGVFVHPFDDPVVIAGQASVGREIAEALPDVSQVVVPIGGGGLASGIALGLTYYAPQTSLVGVQMSGADAMLRSVSEGRVVTLDHVSTVADGLAPGTVSDRTLTIVGARARNLIRLEDETLFPAMRVLLERERVLAEPSGAAAVAALISGQVKGDGPVVAVITGANVSMEHLSKVMATPLPSGLEG
jgi:threonine dehydratase